MSKSIIQSNKKCYVCRTTKNLHEHHIFKGVALRPKAEKYGLKVWLCYRHHNGSNDGVHNGNTQLDHELKQVAQMKFEENYPNLNFVTEFGHNYL